MFKLLLTFLGGAILATAIAVTVTTDMPSSNTQLPNEALENLANLSDILALNEDDKATLAKEKTAQFTQEQKAVREFIDNSIALDDDTKAMIGTCIEFDPKEIDNHMLDKRATQCRYHLSELSKETQEQLNKKEGELEELNDAIAEREQRLEDPSLTDEERKSTTKAIEKKKAEKAEMEKEVASLKQKDAELKELLILVGLALITAGIIATAMGAPTIGALLISTGGMMLNSADDAGKTKQDGSRAGKSPTTSQNSKSTSSDIKGSPEDSASNRTTEDMVKSYREQGFESVAGNFSEGYEIVQKANTYVAIKDGQVAFKVDMDQALPFNDIKLPKGIWLSEITSVISRSELVGLYFNFDAQAYVVFRQDETWLIASTVQFDAL